MDEIAALRVAEREAGDIIQRARDGTYGRAELDVSQRCSTNKLLTPVFCAQIARFVCVKSNEERRTTLQHGKKNN